MLNKIKSYFNKKKYEKENKVYKVYYTDSDYITLILKNKILYITQKDYNMCCNNITLLQMLNKFYNFKIINEKFIKSY